MMKTAKDLELSLLLKEKTIQDLKKDRAELISSNVKLREEKLRLNNIINKAIEYIKNNACYSNEGNTCCDDLYCGDCDKVLNILRGVNKDEN